MRPIAGLSSTRLASGGTSVSGASGGVKSTMSAIYLGDLHWVKFYFEQLALLEFNIDIYFTLS